MLLDINSQVLLSDFGISAIEQNTSTLITQQRIDSSAAGTISYMAPEQIHGSPHPSSDQYALGVVVYELLCGSCLSQRPLQSCTSMCHLCCEKLSTITCNRASCTSSTHKAINSVCHCRGVPQALEQADQRGTFLRYHNIDSTHKQCRAYSSAKRSITL
jgi:serine/threonine protein kinase